MGRFVHGIEKGALMKHIARFVVVASLFAIFVNVMRMT